MSRTDLFIVTILAALAVACESRPQDVGSATSADSAIDDPSYQAALQKWQRDSIVLDSVTRRVNTAELYPLYRKALDRTGTTIQLLTDIQCEESRLIYTYGKVPAYRAVKAMQDTVYADIGVTDGQGYLLARAPREGVVEIGSNCKSLPGDVLKAVGQTRLDEEFPKPRPAPRPRH
jgi:hypothetical protein